MKTSKDYLNDLLDVLDNENQDDDNSQKLDDNQVISEDGDVITLDY